MRAGVSEKAVPAGVAAGHPATTEVGLRTLRMGGSAADAAVAATLAACVAETIFTGLAGGGFATYYDASIRRVTCLDFFCAVPGLDGDRPAGPMRPIKVHFGDVPLPYEIGGASVAVPGVPAGCGAVHHRWGRLPWRQVVAPAIELARDGVPMPAAHALTLPALVDAMLPDQGRSAYAPDGRLLGGGQRLFHAGLADAMTILAEEGPASCYTGALAEKIISTVRADGGALGPLDLSTYQVLESEVAAAVLDGFTVFGRDDLNRTLDTVRALPDGLATMSSARRAVALARALATVGPQWIGDTTNVSVVDRAGNACVITTTLGLGAGLWLPGLGVHLNSMLGEGELDSGEKAAGERMNSMMCPVVVLDGQRRLRLAAGSAGASRIRSALIAALVGVLVGGLSVAQAIGAPRLHPVGRLVHVEPDFPQSEAAALVRAGFTMNRWHARSHYFGGVSAVGSGGAAGDPRRSGSGLLLDHNL